MPTIGSLSAILTLDSSKYERGMRRASSATQRFQSMISGRLSGALASLGGAFAIGGAIRGFKRSLEEVDRQGKFAELIGEDVKQLAGLRHAANLSGVSMQSLEMGLQRMTRRLGQAADGAGEALPALEALGLNAKELLRNSPAQQFRIIADAINSIGDRSRQIAIVQKLFDSEGVPLLRVLDMGSKGLRDMQREAEKLGIAFDKSMTDAAAKTNDELTRMGAQFRALGVNAAVNLNKSANVSGNLAALNANLSGSEEGSLTAAARLGDGSVLKGIYRGLGLAISERLGTLNIERQATLAPLPNIAAEKSRREQAALQKIANNTDSMARRGVPALIAPSR